MGLHEHLRPLEAGILYHQSRIKLNQYPLLAFVVVERVVNLCLLTYLAWQSAVRVVPFIEVLPNNVA